VKAPCSRFTWSSWSQPVNARTGASAMCSSAPSVRSVLLRRIEAMPARTRDVHSAAIAVTTRHTTARPTSTAARDISRRLADAAGVWRELSSGMGLTGKIAGCRPRAPRGMKFVANFGAQAAQR